MSTAKDLSRLLSDKAKKEQGVTNAFIVTFFDIVRDALLRDGIVKVRGLGTFKMMTVKERESVDVNTGERVTIDSHDRVSFTPDATMREAVNKPFSHFETVILNDGVTFDDIDTPDVSSSHIDNERIDETVTVAESESEHVAATEPDPVAEPESEPVAATEPEPVAEPESEPVAEPELEPVAEPELEPVAEPEPEPVAEPEPVSVPEPEPVPDSESVAEPLGESEDEERKSVLSAFAHVVVIFVGIIIIFAAGFVLGRVTSDLNWSYILPVHCGTSEDTVSATSPKTQKPKTLAKEPVVSDTTNIVKAVTKTDDSKPQTVNSKPQTVNSDLQKENSKQKAETSSTQPSDIKNLDSKEQQAVDEQSQPWDYRKYESDPRIRHGAYRIVGVARLIKVKPGETLHSITSRTLGSEMDCYVEALNGKSVSPGQTLKLPKLQLKKKKKKKG